MTNEPMHIESFEFSTDQITSVQIAGGVFFITFNDKGQDVQLGVTGDSLTPDIQEMLMKIYRESLH